MIEEFYGLESAPFRLTPDPRFFFASSTHSKALAYMRYGLQEGEGFIVLTGDVGTGKSTLISYLLAQLDRERLVHANLATSNLDPHDVLQMVAKAFGIVGENMRKADILAALTDFVDEERDAGRNVLLIVDEVQNMPLASLEELRMLTNVTSSHAGGLQCFLVGQPQFRRILNNPEMEQLRQRVIGSCHLEPMDVEETRDYIAHRLEVSGWDGRPALAEDIAEVIHATTGGVPRRINMIFSRLLVYGAIEQRDQLDAQDCQAVIDDVIAEAGPGRDPRPVEAGTAPPPATAAIGTGAGAGNAAGLRELAQRLDGFETALVDLLDTTTAILERQAQRSHEE